VVFKQAGLRGTTLHTLIGGVTLQCIFNLDDFDLGA